MKIRDITMIGMMSAILLVLQLALAFIPNIEMVSLLIIIYTLIFGRKTLFIIYVFVVLEGIVYGIGLWWFSYLYIWAILYLITYLFQKVRSPIIWAVINSAYGFSFGALYAIPYFITGGIQTGIAYWVAGIPFDISHGIGNFVIALLLFHPIYYILDKLNKKTLHIN